MKQRRSATWLATAATALGAAGAAGADVGDRVVFQDTTFEVVAVMDTPAAPHGIAFFPNGARGFAACSGADVVLEFDGATFEPIAEHHAGRTPLDVMLAPNGASLIATQFEGETLVRLSLDDADVETVAALDPGPSLFTPESFDGLRYLVCEQADTVHEIDVAGQPLRSWPTGDRPYPADATDDGILLFVPNRDDGTVSVIDTLNEETIATVDVSGAPQGGAVGADNVDYIVACGEANEIKFINTASFSVVRTLSEGVGPRPFSAAITPSGRFALVNNAGGETVTIIDTEDRRVVGSLPVGTQPIVVRMHPDGRHALVSCEGDDTIHVIRITRDEEAAPGDELTEVVVLGMLHDQHARSEAYSFEVIKDLLRAIGPDAVLTEIPPNRMEAAMADWREDGTVEEPRVSNLPEYENAIFPAADELGFEIVPASGWTQEMNDYRSARLAELAQNQKRREQWLRYARAMSTMGREVTALGARDDPRQVHTEEYDEIMRRGFAPYSRYFNEDLADGGWKNINQKHYALIDEHLDSVSGEGKRVVITFGAGHKYWFLDRLEERDDVAILDVGEFLDQTEAGEEE